MADRLKIADGHVRELYVVVEGERKFLFDAKGIRRIVAKGETLADDEPVYEFEWLFGLHPRSYDDQNLQTLAAMMTRGPSGDGWPDEPGSISAGYTYLGQFIAHELTWLDRPPGGAIKSHRSPQIDLDSLFNPPAATAPGNLCPGIGPLALGCTAPASVFGSFPHDLPRAADGEAAIKDIRNDDVFPLAQIHQLLLRFYDKVAAFLNSQDTTLIEKVVLQHFQSVVLNDYLRTVLDPTVRDDVLNNGRSRFIPNGPAAGEPIRLPVEFATAVFRFGHSMVRNEYPLWNRVNTAAGAESFWKFTHNSRNPAAPPMLTLPSDWVTNWLRLFDVSGTSYPDSCDVLLANKIDSRIAFQLGEVPPHALRSDNTEGDLPLRTLRRGVTLQLADGQTVVTLLNQNLAPGQQIVPLTDAELQLNELPATVAALNANSGELLGSTPLWFYILKEAEARGNGEHLGPAGSRIVMETIHGVLEYSRDSILMDPQWAPILPHRAGQPFEMKDLLAFTGDLNPVGGCTPAFV